MKSKEIHTLQIDSLAFEGKGIAKLNGKIIFVRNAIPGDVAKIQITKNKTNYAEADLVEIIKPSPNRIDPVCKHFGICGGCSFQNMDYPTQLIWKRRFVQDSFEKIAKIDHISVLDPIPSSKIFAYRNKTEFTFGPSRWLTNEEITNQEIIDRKNFALGYFIPGRYDKILDIEECFLHQSRSNKILNLIKNQAIELNIPAYNIKTHKGFLRNLVFRYSLGTNELMVILIVTTQIGAKEEKFLEWIKNDLPKEPIDNLILAFNDSFSPTAGGNTTTIKGNNFLFEKILGIKYKISPFSFFQVNPFQIENLVKKVLDFADCNEKIVWDLYCGIGTLSLPLAKESAYVFGIELVEEAVEDAKENAKLNNVDNAIFYTMDLHARNNSELLKNLEKPEILILDPPRSGVHKNLIEVILQFQPERVVYVSCNPTTLARDYEMLKSLYEIKEIQPIDMFPQTYHIESIALFVHI